MSDTRSNRYQSKLFKDHGANFAGSALRELDNAVFKAEQSQERVIADRDKRIETLEEELESAKDKLRRLQNSRFKSVERELAMSDSSLGEKYDTLVSDVKALVLRLTRSIDGNIKNILNALKQNNLYQKELQHVLEPNVTIQDFVGLLEQSDSPTKLLAFIVRAIVLNMLRLKLFNSNVFICIGGENWKQLRGVYRHLLAAGLDLHGEESEVLVEPADDRFRRDASLWRSQTLATLDRNRDRLKLEDGQSQVLDQLIADIEQLLTPLVKSSEQQNELKAEIRALVKFAAEVSVLLGKQRAMFELEPKRYLGYKVQKGMNQFGPWALETEGEERIAASKSTDILAIIAPALFKFGNDDGEEFEQHRIVRQAHVLVLPSKNLEEPTASTTTASASTASTNTASTVATTITEQPTAVTNSITPDTATAGDAVASNSTAVAPVKTVETPLPPTIIEEGTESGPPPLPPKDDVDMSEPPTSNCPGRKTPEPKALSSELSIDAINAPKVRDKSQKSNTSAAQRSYVSPVKQKTAKKS